MWLTYDTTLEELFNAKMLSVRTYNALRASRMYSLRDVYEYEKAGNTLLTLYKLGVKSKLEVEALFEKLKNSSKEELASNTKIVPKSSNQRVPEAFAKAYNSVNIDNTNVAIYIHTTYENAWEVYNQIFQKTESIMKVRPELSQQENVLFRKYHVSILQAYLANIKDDDDPYAQSLHKAVRTVLEYLRAHCEEFSPYDISAYFLTKQQKHNIEQRFEQICAQELSGQTQDFVKANIKSFEVLVKLFDKPSSAYAFLCPPYSKKKTVAELYKLNQSFKDAFMKMCKMDVPSLRNDVIRNKYPFLTPEQSAFVIDYVNQHNTIPVLYVLFHYLQVSNFRSDRIYSLFYGISGGHRHSTDEVATTVKLSAQRVQQLLSAPIPAAGKICMDEHTKLQYDRLLNRPFLYEGVSVINDLKEKEHLDCDFYAFCGIVQLIFPYRFFAVNKTTSILVRKDVLEKVQLKNIVKQIANIVNVKKPRSITISIDSIIENEVTADIKAATEGLVRYLLTSVYHIGMPDDRTVILPQNCIDVEYELFHLIEKSGEPMRLNDLFKSFKKMYPKHKFKDPMQLKSYLLNSKRISPLGKTSTYALTAWSNLYFGSIRELLVSILSSSDEPMHIDAIMEKVLPVFPRTNQNSVETTMGSDQSNRFVVFEDGFFGLSNRKYGEQFVVKTVLRVPFERRLKNYAEFVEKNHRFPTSSGGKEEQSLQHWYYNVINNSINVTAKQRKAFASMLATYKNSGYPRTPAETIFKDKCVAFKKFICEKHNMPSASKDGDRLYSWFHYTLTKYEGYTDQRYAYFKDLIRYVEAHGFTVSP